MRKWVVFLIVLLLPLTGWCQPEPLFEPMPGKNADASRMHFTLLQKTHAKGKANFLFMWGAINEGDAQKFRQALDQAKAIELWLASPGGDMFEAIEIARIVRAYKLTTRVPSGYKCISACNFIFMGGIVRYVDTGAEFQVHMFESRALALAMHARVLDPPLDILTFTQRYREHPPITIEGFRKMLELWADKQLTEPGIEEAVHEYVDRYKNPAVTCPVDDHQPEQANAAQPEAPQSTQRSAKLLIDKIANVLNQEQKANPPPPKPVDDIPDDPCLKELLRIYLSREAASEEVKFILQHSAQASARIARFLTEMSVSLRFLTEFANIPNDQPRPLTHDELRSLNVVNAD
jgi:hypothetical protein